MNLIFIMLSGSQISAHAPLPQELLEVRNALESRKASQSAFDIQYVVTHKMDARFVKVITQAKNATVDLTFAERVRFIHKGDKTLESIAGPKIQPGPTLLVRERDEWYLFDGQQTRHSERPDFILINKGRVLLRPPPDEFTGETILRDLLSGEVDEYELVSAKVDNQTNSAKLFKIEFKSKLSSKRIRVVTNPRFSHAVMQFEIVRPNGETAWKVDDCEYKEIDGVAYLARGSCITYGWNEDKTRYTSYDLSYSLQSIDTDASHISGELFRMPIDQDATFFDEDSRTTVTSVEQIQAILDDIAAKIPSHPLIVSSSRRNLTLRLVLLLVVVAGVILLWRQLRRVKSEK